MIVWWIIGVHRRFKAIPMESIWATVTAEQLAGAAAGTTVFIVFLAQAVSRTVRLTHQNVSQMLLKV